MSEKDTLLPKNDDNIDAILQEVLGKDGAHLMKRYSTESDSVPFSKRKEQAAQTEEKPPEPPVSAPKNTVQSEQSPELLEADYRAAAAKYEVNGYRFSAPQSYSPYPPYPPYPAYPQPYGYAPYPAYPAYPQQPYGYAPYPAGYEYYDPYQPAQQPAAPEQSSEQNPYAAAAGSRVVYDADWGADGNSRSQTPPQPSVPIMQQPQGGGKPRVNPAFIDPLSADEEDIPPYAENGSVPFADRTKNKMPKNTGPDFFPAGFSAAKNNTAAANGKTAPRMNATAAADEESVFAGFSEDYKKSTEKKMSWLLSDEELQEQKEKRRRKAEKQLLQLQDENQNAEGYPMGDAEQVDDEQARRRMEAQAIIAERFTAAAEQSSASAAYGQAPVPSAYAQASKKNERASDFPPDKNDASPEQYKLHHREYEAGASANCGNELYADTDENDDIGDNIYKGESDLYYNNPNNEPIEDVEVLNEKETKGGKFAAFIRRNTPHKGQTRREFISCLIMDLAFVVLLGGLIFCGIYFNNYQKTRQNDENIENIYVGNSNTMSDVQLEQLWADLRAAYPDIEFPEGLNPDLARLYAVNQDVVGWLEIPNIDLSTVILQADDNDYYLYRDIYKESTKYGTPFVDYRDQMNSTTLSRNTIVYGHNTHDGLKFYNLTRYMELSGYKNAPIVQLNTLFSGMTYWKVFAVTLSDSNTDEFEYLYTSFSSESTFLSYIDNIRAHSMFDIDVDVAAGDNILTLYTCFQNYFAGGRLTVFARQVRAGESNEVNTANASVNGDCLYPDAYYGISYDEPTSIIYTANPDYVEPTNEDGDSVESTDNSYENFFENLYHPSSEGSEEPVATEVPADSGNDDIVFNDNTNGSSENGNGFGGYGSYEGYGSYGSYGSYGGYGSYEENGSGDLG